MFCYDPLRRTKERHLYQEQWLEGNINEGNEHFITLSIENYLKHGILSDINNHKEISG